MALTSLGYIIKISKTLIYAALLYTVSTKGRTILQIYIKDEDENEINAKTLKQILKIFLGVFLYLALFFVLLALLIWELSEESSDDLEKRGALAVHERKISNGFLKDVGMQTKSSSTRDITFRSSSSNNEDTLPERTDDGQSSIEKDQVTRVYNMRASSTVASSQSASTTALTSLKCVAGTVLWTRLDPENNRNAVSIAGLNNNDRSFNNQIKISSWNKFLVDPEYSVLTFDDLADVGKLKHTILEYVIKPFVTRNIIDIPRAILLIGGQGAGKSCIVQVIVNKLRDSMRGTEVKFYKVDSSNCYGSYIDFGKSFHDLFCHAMGNSDVAIILFDNIDQLHTNSISIFLSELSTIPYGTLLVFATTRKRRTLNEQLLHIRQAGDGQFDYIFEIEPPSLWGRADILKVQFKNRECPIDSDDILELANATMGFTAGDLGKLASMINLHALHRYSRTKEQLRKDWDHIIIQVKKDACDDEEIKHEQQFKEKRSHKSASATSNRTSSSASIRDHFNFDSSDSENMLSKIAQWIMNKNGNKM